MTNEKQSKLQISLKNLASSVSDMVDKEITLSPITPHIESLFHWELNDFKYTDKGIENTGAHGKKTLHKYWSGATIKLEEKITQLPDFIEAEKVIKNNCPKSTNSSSALNIFIKVILPIYLENQKEKRLKAIKNVIKIFIRDLKKQPFKGVCSFDIHGITIESERIKLAEGVSLRQSKKEDFEIPTSPIGGYNRDEMGKPRHTVVLEVELMFINEIDINNVMFQTIADKYITLFRLYKPGAVQYNSYSMKTDMILPPFFSGMITQASKASYGLIPYFIKKNDEVKLRFFCKKLILPKGVYDSFSEKKITCISIAYDRYSEALLETTSPERKITNAVMGLEALFSADSMELSFKLSTRVSKLLSFIGYDSLKAKKVLSLAYEVRSAFSHGGHLNSKLKTKIESRHSNIDAFLLEIIDYLRVSLIIFTNCTLKKDDLIKIIDESLIDDRKAKELKANLSKIKLFLF